MYKVAWFARFAPGLSDEDGRRHWREVHGPLGREVPGLERYVQNHALRPAAPAGELAFAGYSCGWYADRNGFLESMKTPEWQAQVDDAPNVFDVDWFSGMMAAVEERTIVDGERGACKVAWVVRFPQEIRGDPARRREANDRWATGHGLLARNVPGIARHVQNRVLEPVEAVEIGDLPLESLGFDGFSEYWFADEAALARATDSPEWDAVLADAAGFFDLPFSLAGMNAVVEERVVKDVGV